MAVGPLAPSDLSRTAPVVTRNPWKSSAIVLALLLAAVLIATALVVTDVMKLGFDLF
jgi:hypothetical protein